MRSSPAGPILKTLIFTIFVPGTVAVYVPSLIVDGFRRPQRGLLTWAGTLIIAVGAAIYFRCAWEFAVRGLGTPARRGGTSMLHPAGLLLRQV